MLLRGYVEVREALETLQPVRALAAPTPRRERLAALADGADLDAALAGLVATHTGAPLAVSELLRQRPRWVELCADPSLVENVVEELLRVAPPVPLLERADLRLDIAAANRDERMFRSPNRIEPRRRRARAHLSFGAGPHACPGADVARAQARALLEELTRRFPGLRLVDEVSPVALVRVR